MAPVIEQKPSFLFTAVRNHPTVVAILVLAGITLGLFYVYSQPTVHSSTAQVLINPVGGNPFAPAVSPSEADQLSSLQTEAEVARSDDVLQEVNSPEMPVTSDSLSVTVLPNTQILEIGYSASDPQLARDTAQAVSEAYLENRRARYEALVSAELARLERRTERVISDLRSATELANQGSPERRAFQSELANSLTNELVNLRDQRATLESSTVVPGEIITPATSSAGGSLQRELLVPFAGGLIGLALGIGAAASIERRAGRVRSLYDVRAAGLDVLGTDPYPQRSLRRRGHSGRSHFQESIRWLRAAILESSPPCRSLAVSSEDSAASSAVAEAVAGSLGKLGNRVVVVDGDPTAHNRPGRGKGEVGFVDLLAGAPHSLDAMSRTSPVRNVTVIRHGWVSGDSRDYYVPERVSAALLDVAPAGGHVVIKAPGLTVPEGESVAKAVDLTVVLIVIGVTRKRDVSGMAAALASSDARAFAMLIDKSDIDHSASAAGSQTQRRRRSRQPRRHLGEGQAGSDDATGPGSPLSSMR